MEIVTWAAVGVACQQQFSYNLVLKFGSVNTIDVDSIHIPCTLGECEFNSHSNRIKCEKALSQLKHWFECAMGYNLARARSALRDKIEHEANSLTST